MSRLSSLFARRYLSSRKSLSVINIISKVSIVAVGVPVAAMIILLSVFNGFEGLVKSMYNSFDPDILVLPAKGKVFPVELIETSGLRHEDGVGDISYVLDESVLLEYRGSQAIATLRGVDSLYQRVVPIRDLVIHGNYELRFGDMEQAIVGQGIAWELGIRTHFYNSLNIYAPKRSSFSSLLPMDSYYKDYVFPAGIFTLDMETDGTYVISTIEFAQRLLNYDGQASKVMVSLKEGTDQKSAQKKISALLGDDYRVQTRYEQKASMYRIMQYEKWGIFFIAMMILVIASFSVVGSLVMLIIDKRPDIRILMTMGGDVRFARRIFVNEGMLIGLSGVFGGLLLGTVVCLVQQHFGLLKIGADSFVVDSYPGLIQLTDVLSVLLASLLVCWAITRITVNKMIPKSSIRL